MSGFCFLWDRSGTKENSFLQALGEQALDAISHPWASRRVAVFGDGWWLGLCRGEGEPQARLAADPSENTHVLLSGWLENYSELLDEFRTGPAGTPRPDDVDLLLEMYQRSGLAALERARGPLAALVWEPGMPRLTAVRDHLGESAVCFADRHGLLMLASEEAALLRHPAVSSSPDLGWLARFASRMPLPPGRTAFQEITELSPGDRVQWGRQSFGRSRMPASVPTRLGPGSDRHVATARWREALGAGIPAATRRGRQFGLMLSGGLDSTTTTAFAVPAIRASGREVAAYSWRLERFSEGDESSAIQAVADLLHVPVHWFQGDDLYPVLDTDTWPVCPNLPQLNPFLRLNLAVYKGARSAGCDVLLNGHLGDSLYPYRFQGLADALRSSNGDQTRRELQAVVRRFGLARAWRSAELRNVIKLFLGVPRRRIVPRFLSTTARERFENVEPWPPESAAAPHPQQCENLFGTISAMELKYERYFAERSGIERRHPLRHHRILETVLSLPSFLFFDDLRDKVLTRDAMEGRLPDRVLHGAQGGLLNGMFLHGFFQAGLPALRSLLARPEALWPEILSRDYVDETLRAGAGATAEQQRVLIAAAGIELWKHALECRSTG